MFRPLNLDSNAWGNWTVATRAVLGQKLSTDAFSRGIWRVVTRPVSVRSTGEYDNVVGSVIGTSQEPMVFYIPQDQGGINPAFTESNKIEVRVTVVDTAQLWNGSSYERSSVSSTLQLINKIAVYDFTVGDLTEPYNTDGDSNHPLYLNIPVDSMSIHGKSVIVEWGYASNSLSNTVTVDCSGSNLVTFGVNPNSGTTLYYSVQYVVNNVNRASAPYTTAGLTVSQNVPNKFFPEDSDYDITATSYKTFNTGAESSITFSLGVNAASTNRIDGVNVYFSSPDTSDGSDIAPVRIGTYLFSDIGSKTIRLLYDPDPAVVSTVNVYPNSNITNYINYITDSGTIVSEDLSADVWGDFDRANISFKAYRDRRVVSSDASYNTLDYVESGLDEDSFDDIWNVPQLVSPNYDGSVRLEGGVRNSDVDTKLTWTQHTDANGNNFTYDLTMIENDNSSTLIHNIQGLDDDNQVLGVDQTTNAKYTVTLRTVFDPQTTGAMREVSDPVDTITFYTIHVDVLGVNIQVKHPSDTQKVNLSWVEPVITGDSVTLLGSESSSFNNNIDAHYIEYTLNSGAVLTRLDPLGNLIERITGSDTMKEYDLPVTTLATKYSFYMYIEASIVYKVNTDLHDTEPVEISDTTTTSSDSRYIVSSIPSIGLPSTTPVIISGQYNPTLLLNLNANGLEEEGFISVVIILTQDGTADKPEGEQALLVFPDSGSNFNFGNALQGPGAGSSDLRLAGGDSATSASRDITNTNITTDPSNNAYTLTIGTVGSDGRYGYSTLQMPSSDATGFENSGDSTSSTYNPVNYMVILTTRRGTNIDVGTFEYQRLPAVNNVNITTTGGQYFVNFTITPS
jgi:hypothetical protein